MSEEKDSGSGSRGGSRHLAAAKKYASTSSSAKDASSSPSHTADNKKDDSAPDLGLLSARRSMMKDDGQDDYKAAMSDFAYFSQKYGSGNSSSGNKATGSRAEAKSTTEDQDTDVSEAIQRRQVQKEIEDNRSTVDVLRQELEQYLGKLDAKTDADGKKLISVPDNFNSIISAMTREDLLNTGKDSSSTSTTTPPWYEYLLSEHVNQRMHDDFQGRYDQMLHKDNNKQQQQIKRGLAEISLLDRQLQLLGKKSQLIDKETSLFMTHQADDAEDDLEIMSGRSTPNKADPTFMTKFNNKSSSQIHSNATTPRTARSQNTTTLMAQKKLRPDSQQPISPLASSRQHKQVTISGNEEVIVDDRDRDGEWEDNNEEEGGLGKILPHQLTELQKARLKELLEGEDDDALLEGYIPKELQEQDDKLMHELGGFGRLDRLLVSDADLQDSLEQEKKSDFLAQQRKERKQKEYEKNIESMLGKCKSGSIDYSYLMVGDEDNVDAKSAGGRSMYSKSLHEVPSIEDVHMDVPITKADIELLIEGLKNELQQSRSIDGEPSALLTAMSSLTQDEAFALMQHQMNRDGPASVSNSMPATPMTTTSNAFSLASRQEIEALLASYQAEMTRIQLAKYRKIASREDALRQQRQKEQDNNKDPISARGTHQDGASTHNSPNKRSPSKPSPTKSSSVKSSPRNPPHSGSKYTLESNLSYDNGSNNAKFFDDDDLKMLPLLLQSQQQPSISLPPIPSARDAQGNKKTSSQHQHPPVPILPTSRRVQKRPSSNGGVSAKNSAREEYRIDSNQGKHYFDNDNDDDDEMQYHYNYNHGQEDDYEDNYDYQGYQGDEQEEEERYKSSKSNTTVESLRQSLVDQVRKVVEC